MCIETNLRHVGCSLQPKSIEGQVALSTPFKSLWERAEEIMLKIVSLVVHFMNG